MLAPVAGNAFFVIGEYSVVTARRSALAALVARPVDLLARTLSPIVWVLERSAELFLRLLGVREVIAGAGIRSADELRALVDEAEGAGVIPRAQEQLLHNVFDFPARGARDVMVPALDIDWLDADLRPAAALDRFRETPHRRDPVGRGSLDRLAGEIHVRELVAGERNARGGDRRQRAVGLRGAGDEAARPADARRPGLRRARPASTSRSRRPLLDDPALERGERRGLAPLERCRRPGEREPGSGQDLTHERRRLAAADAGVTGIGGHVTRVGDARAAGELSRRSRSRPASPRSCGCEAARSGSRGEWRGPAARWSPRGSRRRARPRRRPG